VSVGVLALVHITQLVEQESCAVAKKNRVMRPCYLFL